MKTRQLIFYLDDDLDDLEFFKDIAENLGHRVSTFTNGNELFYSLRHEWEKPDIIFLDIHMPVLNGEEILDVIKKSEDYKHIPIVMISGAYPKKLVRHFQESGANYLMKKPLVHDFESALEEVLKIDMHTLHALTG
jgi:CheY-like chemotaxis protein